MFKMKKLPTEDATDEQIKEYVQALDVDASDTRTRSGLIALLGSVADDSFIMVPDVPDSLSDAIVEQMDKVSRPAQQRLEGGMGDSDPRFKIEIGQTAYPGGKDPVPVSVNGRTAVIQRNMTVDLPARYYYALKDAIRVEVEQADIGKERTEIAYSNYPITVHDMPTKAELAEWHERVDSVDNPA